MNYKTLGSILRDARKAKNLTQKDVANHIGVTFQNISSWELGKSKIDIDTLLEICDFYDLSFVDVLNKCHDDKSRPSGDERVDKILAKNKPFQAFYDILMTLPENKQKELLEIAIVVGEQKLKEKNK